MFGKQMLVKPSGEADKIQERQREEGKATFSNNITWQQSGNLPVTDSL